MSSNISINLPKGWIKTRVEEVCKTKSGGTPSRKNPDYFGGKISWIKSGELNDSIIYSCEETITKLGLEKSNAVLYPKNTVLLAMYGATIGKISLLGISASTNQAICAFYHNEKIITNLYLFWFLKSIRRNLVNIGFGGAQKNISQEKIKRIWIPLPPLNEQKRIVIKIESIFAQIDATKEQLEMLVSKTKFVPGSLNTLRNSVLKQAFEGKLVPQDLNDEPAEILLKRISKDFKELILKNDRLPKGWTKTNVGQLYDIIGGGTPSTKIEKYWKGNIPWISSADIYDLYDIRPRRSITVEAVKSSATNLVPSESIIVVTRVGLGKIAYTKTPICFSQDSQALVGNNSIIDPHYALYYLSKAVQIFKYSNRGTTISGVTKKQLSELSFFLPPLNEQKRIVAKIESIFGNIDTLNLFYFILLGNLFTNLRYFIILSMPHAISDQ